MASISDTFSPRKPVILCAIEDRSDYSPPKSGGFPYAYYVSHLALRIGVDEDQKSDLKFKFLIGGRPAEPETNHRVSEFHQGMSVYSASFERLVNEYPSSTRKTNCTAQVIVTYRNSASIDNLTISSEVFEDVANLDDFVNACCFSPSTMIMKNVNAHGPVDFKPCPAKGLVPGDLVLTELGPQKIIACVKSNIPSGNKRMSELSPACVLTPGHPVLGPAGYFVRADSVVPAVDVRIDTVLNFEIESSARTVFCGYTGEFPCGILGASFQGFQTSAADVVWGEHWHRTRMILISGRIPNITLTENRNF